MRDILFRGKRKDNGKWVEGYYVHLCDCKGNESHRIYSGTAETDCGEFYEDFFEVDPETVGQWTGLHDSTKWEELTEKEREEFTRDGNFPSEWNGKKIFEGDVVKTHYANAKKCDFIETVVFHNGRFCAEGNLARNGKSWAMLWDGVHHLPQEKTVYMDGIEVIGNIHDNPELLQNVWKIPKLSRWTPEDVAMAKALKLAGIERIYRVSYGEINLFRVSYAGELLNSNMFLGLGCEDGIDLDTIIKEAEG